MTRLIALFLLSFLTTSCTYWHHYIMKPDPPVCNADTPIGVVALEPERDITRILIFGDGLGDSPMSVTVAKMARTVCDERGGCSFGIYLGDVYQSGANTEDEFAEKIQTVFDELNLHVYMAYGNHEYYGDPQAYYDLAKSSANVRLPCNQYFISDDHSYTFRVIDTNHPTQAAQPLNMAKLCDALGFHAFVGHHPLWSSGKTKRNSQEKKTRKHFEKVIRKCGDVYFAGHDHHGELLKSVTEEGTIVQVIEGRFGRSRRSVIKGTDNQLWIAKGYGFSIFEIPLDGRPYLMFFDELGKMLYAYEF